MDAVLSATSSPQWTGQRNFPLTSVRPAKSTPQVKEQIGKARLSNGGLLVPALEVQIVIVEQGL
jgi:hypothetical protein